MLMIKPVASVCLYLFIKDLNVLQIKMYSHLTFVQKIKADV